MIDGFWAELFEIHPWITEGYTGRGSPDTTRTMLKGPNVVGVLEGPGTRMVGETADAPSTQQIENEVWLSVDQTIIGDPTYWATGDRVFLPDRGEWFEILYIGPSTTFRPFIHLTRVQKVDEEA